jgi:MerR family gold-responsive transcriptional activator of gol and ges genes
MSYNIGETAELSGISAKMIRYYEKVGLVPPAQRTDSGYRNYTEDDVHILRFIRRARDLGFSVKQIEGLLALWLDRDRASSEVKELAQFHLLELTTKLKEIEDMVETLRHLIDHCHGDHRPECPILSGLEGEQIGNRESRASRPR